nr:immunoglobulin heavy chain junction region [Mus musculus]
CARLGFAYW